ncbi:glycosyltransferase family 4 protein [Streptomonospora halophila]|uniref:Glycosyltransferase family 4 protein n=1 Tax=Streptomonospora halophila TaxID=427369 RepID=A0ABP9GRA4_9ACTN
MRIAFLLHNAYGIGGTIRSTVNLATALAERHDVEIVSIHRPAANPSLVPDPRVALRWLLDVRADSGGPARDERERRLRELPNTVYPDPGVDGDRLMHYTALHDERIGACLRDSDADVVIATRPILNGYLARHRRRGQLRIGQEHLSMDAHDERLRRDQNAAIADLDAFVTVSEADAAQYRAALADAAPVVCIPNGVALPEVEPSTLDSKTIVAAGRLVQVKRYDRLLEAFAKVVVQYPEWSLRIYGRGRARAGLRRQIDEMGLNDSAMLMGPAAPIETEWAKGAVAAVASDRESFGMTIVESMHCGVPVVATDCPFGPAEIISHGSTGLLVGLEGGADAFAQALVRLIADEEERRAMGRAARSAAAAWAPETVAHRYEALFEERTPRRRTLPRLRDLRHGSAPAKQEPLEPKAPRYPRVRARAGAEGRIGLSIDADSFPPGAWGFLTRLRHAKEEMRFPLPAPDSRGRVRFFLSPAAEDFAEGRWDCWIVPRDGEGGRRRLMAAQVEQAGLLRGPGPVHDGDSVRHCIPYTTADGFLALRVWNRPAHAEVVSARPGEPGIRLCARLLLPGPPPDQGMRLHIVHREEPASSFEVEARPDTGDPALFHALVPHDLASERRTGDDDIWDLALQPAPDAPPVPIGRIGGDIADRKKVHVYAPTRLDHHERGRTRVRLFYTVDNHLALAHRAEQ